MRIYTKKGDKGETGLFGGGRVSKDSPRIEAYGAVDELNSLLGVARSSSPPKGIDKILARLQADLFVLGADLATPRSVVGAKVPRIRSSNTRFLERTIDSLERSLPRLTSFVLPFGTPAAAHLHLARTVCRRAERLTVRLSKSDRLGADVIPYLNRLSDLLFVLARYANWTGGGNEIRWTGKPRGA
ncbi:MAG TPA: cob(I)yrinic acid a,c-diamide adenosyltransferase [Bacteroidota bacterium]|nr:cob(I)yrinic acid a,c-diamide adenosyltransferase [Bacteroidota bacterium]